MTQHDLQQTLARAEEMLANIESALSLGFGMPSRREITAVKCDCGDAWEYVRDCNEGGES